MHNKGGLLAILAIILTLPSAARAQDAIHWEATLESAQRLAGQTNRLVLIEFWAPWCVVCKRMEAEVYSQPSVAAGIALNYVPVKINADYFPATAQQYGVTALPTTVVTSPQGQLLDTIVGRAETADYVARLNQIAAAAKPRSAPVYAQVPASAPATPPPAAANPAALAASRPADPARPSPAAPAAPIIQPASNVPGPAGPQTAAAHTNTTPTPAAVLPVSTPAPGVRLAQTIPPSQPTAAAPPVRQSASPSTGAPAGNPTQQPPAINPPLGLDGYCPVVLSERQQWALGDRRWGAIHRGRTYLFTGPEEQARFFTNPDRYAPAVSGNDVVLAAEQGQPVPGMREHGVFFGNRVYLFSSEATLDKFARNPILYANQASGAVRTGANAAPMLH